MRTHWTMALALTASAFLAFGCSSTKMETTEVPKPAPAVEPQPEPAVMTPMERYTVARRDTLWDISGKQSIYGDNFQWPLIFKTNRDQIQDPDLIHPKQELGIKKDFTMEEVDHARDLASRTPKYVPHTKPRETLPIDYF